MDTTLLIFALVYLALALGHLPGFRVDRTGAVVAGALAMIAMGRIGDQAAWTAIDYRTIGLLFGLMVVSGAFVVSGFYSWVAARIASMPVSPPMLLAILVVTGGVLSALLTNDVVVVAMTPLLVAITLSRGLNPTPFLLGFCFACNTGSAATLIGSPQNMVAASALHLDFTGYLKVALVPALLSLPIVWAIVAFLYRHRWTLSGQGPAIAGPEPSPTPLDVVETVKAALVTLAVMLAFVLTDWPHDMVALGAAAVMLVNRTVASKDVLKAVDGNLLLLLMGLFVVNAAFAATGLPQKAITGLSGMGIDLTQAPVLYGVVSVLSNIVGNNPAVMLLAPFVAQAPDAQALGAAFALGTGFSSNIIVFGSLAGIIVVEQAAARGVTITTGEFCRAGVPVALSCLAMGLVWILLIS
jgi:Na+/H+ antiporter NhaD/arsenite permease-like protein